MIGNQIKCMNNDTPAFVWRRLMFGIVAFAFLANAAYADFVDYTDRCVDEDYPDDSFIVLAVSSEVNVYEVKYIVRAIDQKWDQTIDNWQGVYGGYPTTLCLYPNSTWLTADKPFLFRAVGYDANGKSVAANGRILKFYKGGGLVKFVMRKDFEDSDFDGFQPPTDCNDNDYWVNPFTQDLCHSPISQHQPELTNWIGVDNDCDGHTDEDYSADDLSTCYIWLPPTLQNLIY